MFFWNGEQIHWDLSLVRNPNDWEEESVGNLLAELAAMEVKPQGDDELACLMTQKGLSISRVFVMVFKIGRGILIFLW